jgi:asparagine synthase (glutamine-hydrolysing)
MQRRGPDAEGIWTREGVVLGHRRLAILDLDRRSNQPFISVDGNYGIVFNGEIYNFRALRAELEQQGVVFRTTSDTEVLLAMFAREGERMLPRLRGMFAFAIWDVRSGEMFLARDPYGIKPLYYAQTEQGVAFASQVKALLASQLVSREHEWAGLAGFYLWGSVPEPWTPYRGVFALPAGSWMQVRAGQVGVPVYWNDIRTNWQCKGDVRDAADLEEKVRRAVADSVRAHLVSDVPVCVFLSGGIDSGALAGLLSELGARVEGITIGFSEFSSSNEDEVPVAAHLADHYGLPHHIRKISSREFEEDIPRIIDAMDLPSIDGVNTYFASKAAAERGYKVALSGAGGDELFHGYTYMRSLPKDSKLARRIACVPGVASSLRGLFAMLAKYRGQPKFKAIPEFMRSIEGAYFLQRGLFLPEELPILMGKEAAREGMERLGGLPPGVARFTATDDEARVCQLDSTMYLRNQLLRDSDWASMAHSLELRTPLVDATLLESLKDCLTLFDGGAGKKMLAHSPTNPIPKEVINRPKTGFGVPMNQWLTSALEKRNPSGALPDRTPGMPWARRWARTIAEAV